MRTRLGAVRPSSRVIVALVTLTIALALCSCGARQVSVRTLGITVSVQGAFTQVYASSAPITLAATLDDDPTNQGVVWQLSLGNTSCSPACGTLARSDANPHFSIIYKPPATPPLNTTATITAFSAVNHASVFAFNFTILPAISVSITNKFSTQLTGDPSVVVNATVSGDLAGAGVTWTLTINGQPCAPANCGTLVASAAPSFSATYTPPALPAGGANPTPTITATSVTDPTKNDNFTFTINPGILVTITNKFAKQTVGGPAAIVNVTVANDSANGGASWALLDANGQPCPQACGTLVASAAPSFSATYTPPATQPTGANANPTIVATSVTNPTKSDSFSFVITFGTNVFTGSYSFLLRGFDLNGNPLALAGSVTSDGQGDITGGDLDVNNSGGITAASALTGSYDIDSSFNGIIRGTITLTNVTFGGTNFVTPVSFKFVLSSDHKHGRILELDGVGFVNVGTLELQDPAALSSASPAGTYAFGVDSDSPIGGRTVGAGQIILSSTSVTGGLVDVSKSGDPSPRYTAAPLTPSALTAPDSSGRGTLTLSVAAAGAVPASADKYAYYIVNSGQLYLMQIDAAPTFGTVFAGVARAQKPLTATSINTVSVLQLTGMDTVPMTTTQVGPDVIIGVMTIPNPLGGPASFTMTFDENDLGKTGTGLFAAGHIVGFDPSTGRGTFSDPGGFGDAFMDSAVFYLYDAGSGFVIDTDPSTCVPVSLGCVPPNNYPITNNAFSGTLTPQVPGLFGQNSTVTSADVLSGNLTLSSGASVIENIPSLVAGVALSPSGTLQAKGDFTSQNFQVGNLPDATFNGTYVLEDTVLGHGLIRLPQQIFGDFTGSQDALYSAFFYIIGPNQFVAIGVQKPAVLGTPLIYSGVIFADPQ